MKSDKLLSKATLKRHKLFVIKDDSAIVDYMLDSQKNYILKEFQDHKDNNTGVSMFFDSESDYKQLVVIMCLKFFKNHDDNGLVAMILTDMHVNPNGAEMMKDLLKIAFTESPELIDSMMFQIDRHVNQSVNYHAGY